MNKGFLVSNVDGVKLSKTEKNKEVKNFILKNVEDFLAYAIDYSLYDKFFSGKKF